MADTVELVRRFLDGLVAGSESALTGVLHEDVTLRFWGWRERVVARPRSRVVPLLLADGAGWVDAVVEVFDVLCGDHSADRRIAAEYRVQATQDGRYTEHNRSLFATIRDDTLHTLDIYAPLPLPSAHRKGWQAPATLNDEEVSKLLAEGMYTWDPREHAGPNNVSHLTQNVSWGGAGIAHPGGNFVGGSRWTAEEADARIEEMIEQHRARGIGFQWWTGPYDTPPDLAERLARHGLLEAGEVQRMARVGLDDLSSIPMNPDVTVEVLDGTDVKAIEAMVSIMAECFHMSAEQVDEERPSWYESVQDPEQRAKTITCLARLDGRPVAMGRVGLRGPTCYLGGAATLPNHRGKHIYSTLLRKRLAAAHDRGFNIAVIDAGPMSGHICAKYGFKVFGTIHVFGWMPVMDAKVIKTLVTDD